MFIGIDIGTSAVKLALIHSSGKVIANMSEPLQVSSPHPLWSEQDPDSWWQATQDALDKLASQHSLREVRGLSLSGQMHGATLLNAAGRPLRPAILWNDGRSHLECTELERAIPDSRELTGNLMMPGFTAPKLLWLKKNEPEVFKDIAKVLLPKDYIRYRLSGDYATDCSDAAGTLWLNTRKRCWSPTLIEGCGLDESQMPALYEGNRITGELKSDLARRWGMPVIPIAGGASDNAAGAIGAGVYQAGQGMLSLGTSGVYFVASDHYLANPGSALHSFCHALPQRWHLMSVILSAASCLEWLTRLTRASSVAELMTEAANTTPDDSVYFLPYLSGERTPHNNPLAQGVFFGMTHETERSHLTYAVLEGVGYALADGFDALHQSGLPPQEISLIGGGARSPLWRQMLCDIIGQPLAYRQGSEIGPALGAARLAQLAVEPAQDLARICQPPTLIQAHQVQGKAFARHQHRRLHFQKLYRQLRPLFSDPS
ncbi:xylulokinase [Dongshaea marina]|uniref:xylulokinase n=1 Tax=Dongshaea marina TaxID=2047966 RepID=UPI000D3E4E5A|nr:xylulokinase [Dongshaea marina]